MTRDEAVAHAYHEARLQWMKPFCRKLIGECLDEQFATVGYQIVPLGDAAGGHETGWVEGKPMEIIRNAEVLGDAGEVRGWQDIEERLNGLCSLPEGWDGYGGLPPSEVVGKNMLNTLKGFAAMGWHVHPDAIVPTCNGTLMVESDKDGYEFLIEVGQTKASAYCGPEAGPTLFFDGKFGFMEPAAPGQPQGESEKLWLWRNGNHYLAFNQEHPCVSLGGDPCTLGEPAAMAIIVSRHPDALPLDEYPAPSRLAKTDTIPVSADVLERVVDALEACISENSPDFVEDALAAAKSVGVGS
jgi:hypothetical protein